MEQKATQQLIIEYLDLLRRGKYFIIVPLIISVFIGTAIAFKLPKVYRAEAKLFYMQAQIPDWAKLETINMYLEAMLIFIEAWALVPENVLRLINELDLYPELEGRVARSDLISHFRGQYSMKYDYTSVPTRFGRAEEVITGFTFSFEHTDGRQAYYVVNALATNYVELFRRFREQFSAQTSSFFENERERLRREITLIDQRIADFKLQHVNELPELFALNYRMVDNLNNKLFSVDQQMLRLRSLRRNLEAQISTVNPVLGMTGISGERIVTPQERLAALNSELGQLRARYSDRHPDVRRAQHEIAELETIVNRKSVPGASPGDEGSLERVRALERYVLEQAGGAFNPTYIQLMIQLEEIKIDIVNLGQERVQYETDLAEYERRLGVTPLVEKEWRLLDRDLDSAQNRYNELVSQVLTMESAAEMERREMGGRLSIGQPPVIPLTHAKPDIPQIIGLSLVVGLAIGVGLLLGWDFITKSVRVPRDFISLFDIPVLATLPIIMVKEKSWLARFDKIPVRVVAVLLIIAVFVAVDLFYMKVDILVLKIITVIQTRLALLGF